MRRATRDRAPPRKVEAFGPGDQRGGPGLVETVGAILAAISLTVLGAHLADRTFGRLRLPDVPLLLALGWVMGPATGLVAPGGFGPLLPLLAVVAIVVVLLDGVLMLSTRDAGRVLAEGLTLSLGVFVATMAIVAGLVHLVMGFDVRIALLLGAMVGGAGIVIVIPLVRTLQVSDRAVGIVTLEAVIADLFVVLAVSFLADAFGPAPEGGASLRGWTVGIVVAATVGGVAAGAWSLLTFRREGSEHEYIATVAILIGTYGLAEHLEGPGIVAALAFALVIARFPVGRRLRPRTRFDPPPVRRRERLATVFRDEGRAHHDVIFLVRAFFFVGVGIVLDWSAFGTFALFATGLIVAGGVVLGRVLVTVALLRSPRWVRRDRDAVALMFPLGLVAAVTSVIPLAEGVPASSALPAIVAVALVLTNVLAALGVATFRHTADAVADQPPS